MNSKYTHLCHLLKQYGKVAVAYSGGVDSTLLLYSAVESLGAGNVIAVFARSELQKKATVSRALGQAREFGCRVLEINVSPLSWQDFVGNPPDRCYLCKRAIYTKFLESIPKDFMIVDGTNIDDLEHDRPGHRALKELSINTPLVESLLTKNDIRNLSKQLGLSTWDLPSESCLATRIPTGTEISQDKLVRVERAEEFLADLGFAGCRVRFEEYGVVVSIHERDFSRIGDSLLREKIISFFNTHSREKILLDFCGRVN